MKLVGKVIDAHGLGGELYVHVFSGDVSWLKKLKSFGLGNEKKDEQIFEVERAKVFKKGFIIKPKGVSDRNASELLRKKYFYIDESLLISKKGETIFLREILDFKVFKKGITDSGEVKQVGDVIAFSSNGPQDLLVIKNPAGHQFEVPFVDAFLVKIDFDARTVLMDLPEGLDTLDAKDNE